jgi:hypothetical protein
MVLRIRASLGVLNRRAFCGTFAPFKIKRIPHETHQLAKPNFRHFNHSGRGCRLHPSAPTRAKQRQPNHQQYRNR